MLTSAAAFRRRTEVRKQTAWEIHYAQPGGVTGHVMLLLMVRLDPPPVGSATADRRFTSHLILKFLMYTTAHRKIRTTCFEAFW